MTTNSTTGHSDFIDKIFTRPDTTKPYDYVFNCAGETRSSEDDEVYRSRTYDLSVGLGRAAAARKVGCFVECSTGQVYSASASESRESDKLKPWTRGAKWKLSTEEALTKLATEQNLPLVILRFAFVYGEYSVGNLSTVLCLARTFQAKNEKMEWLWDRDLRVNSVHVRDAVRAIWHAAEWYTGQRAGKGRDRGASNPPVFNIVDHGHLSQGAVADLVAARFDIVCTFHGKLVSTLARLNLENIVDNSNDETLDLWAELQEKAEIKPGPISPFLEVELLKDNDLSMNGSAFESTTGFKYEHEKLDAKQLDQVLESYKRMGWWP